MDFAPNNYGDDPFPKAIPSDANTLRWQNDDWDPALRFWNLAFDPNLVEWLKSEDTSLRSTTAAREFAKEHKKWRFDEATLKTRGWLTDAVHLGWKNGTQPHQLQWITTELAQLFKMMEDDRERYLGEIEAQADGLAAYLVSFLGIDSERRPHTIELIRCGLAIGNVFYMSYKEFFRRVRASTICPGLVPPFGPPRHPSFPSGHSFLGHFIALLLLEIPEVAQVFGEDPPTPPGQPTPKDVRARNGRQPTLGEVMSAGYVFRGQLLWLGDRLAKNRERAGLHYPSDSAASRWMAGAVWALLTKDSGHLPDAKPPGAANSVTAADLIDCPSLRQVLRLAKAEWART
jgi:membrane-associated phospholipid phosphatase